MNVAALIVGIDGWQTYTEPLIDSLRTHEPDCRIVVIDNASSPSYPAMPGVHRTKRLCYAAAINAAKRMAGNQDWYIVLSNDTVCTAPFVNILDEYGDSALVGPLMKSINIERVGIVDYLEGWCVSIPNRVWQAIGDWDSEYQISSYEDCDYSRRAQKADFCLVEDTDFPFSHLDQKQRFYLVPDYWTSEYHNRARFIEKHAQQVIA